MFIAEKLRASNITGYVIYMYQVEDLIRAYGLDLDRICSEYLSRFQYSDEQMRQEREWFEGLIRMMNEEHVREHGHVRVVYNTMELMVERHRELMDDSRHPFYSVAYYKALPSIVDLRARGSGTQKNEIETCLDAVYGITLLKMQGKEVGEATQKALAPIVALLQMLAQYYRVPVSYDETEE